MEKYIALLRGINISGKNKIRMADLKTTFEEAGFQQVSTYINSGNVIFSTFSQSVDSLNQKCQQLIENRFNLKIPVTVVSASDLEEILYHAPQWWNIDKTDINYLIFLIPPTTVEEVYRAVGEAKKDYEKVASFNQAIFLTAAKETYTKATWSKIASSSVNNQVTIRNANTANKLLNLCTD